MPELAGIAWAGAAILLVSVVAWLVSIWKQDVSFVDSLWSLFFLLSVSVYVITSGPESWRVPLVLALVAVWSLRLSVYITARNHGQPEDHRYQKIRSNNQPHFQFKSLYIVFLLQGFLAWVIGLPLIAAVNGQTPPGPFDLIGVALYLVGMFFEVVGDYQLSRFKAREDSEGAVLDSGLWRYTRHPNYFGEAMIWWGFWFLAVSAGGWWTVFAPIMMTFLLLKVSGVTLLEKDIAQRRPQYRDYVRKTNAFIPGPPKKFLTSVVSLALLLPLSLSADIDDSWQFKVFLDDREIGYHHFYLDEIGETRELRSEAEFDYKIMFISLFEYEHENREVWQGNCLQRIDARTNSNGEPFQVEGSKNDEGFLVKDDSGGEMLPQCVMSFAYWNPAFLNQRQLLNSQNGEFEEVSISSPVFEELEVRGEKRPSYRYRLAAGDLNLDLWYSTENEWLALESEVSGGRTLRYVLK